MHYLLLALVACCSPCFSPQLFEGDSGDRAVQPFLALLAAALNLLVPQLHQKGLQVMTTVAIGGARLLAYDTSVPAFGVSQRLHHTGVFVGAIAFTIVAFLHVFVLAVMTHTDNEKRFAQTVESTGYMIKFFISFGILAGPESGLSAAALALSFGAIDLALALAYWHACAHDDPETIRPVLYVLCVSVATLGIAKRI